ncbi:hypothetical protein EBU71_16585 [bacterium]|nr:hypothetical protein [Candidatus Elulimicrobium humile]
MNPQEEHFVLQGHMMKTFFEEREYNEWTREKSFMELQLLTRAVGNSLSLYYSPHMRAQSIERGICFEIKTCFYKRHEKEIKKWMKECKNRGFKVHRAHLSKNFFEFFPFCCCFPSFTTTIDISIRI